MKTNVDDLLWQEKLILRKAIKIRELFASLVREMGERPDGDVPLLNLTIFQDGTTCWYSIKKEGTDEDPNIYYTDVYLDKEDYDAESTDLHS